MTAESIATALGGRKVGTTWMAKCPTHEDGKPSLSINDAGCGKVLVHCHAGCEQQRVIAALKSLGVWPVTDRRHGTLIDPQPSPKDKLNDDHATRSQAALRIWGTAAPANGTLVETYLRSRGIVMPTPATLRLHARLKHPSGGIWPAMIALVTRGTDGVPLAIHRTFISRDGKSKAPVNPQKMMLGPCRDGAVRLAEPGNVLMVGEGIESCLAAMQATGYSAWAALSTSGLRALGLPLDVRNLIVLADGDAPGEAAAQECAARWKQEGRRVRIARPPHGLDFNDLLWAARLVPWEAWHDTAHIKCPVELLRDGKGIYGIGVAKEVEIDSRPADLILRHDHLPESQPRRAVLQMITGGFRHGMFTHMSEEHLRQVIHHEMLRRAGLAWPPPSSFECPYWSSDPQQQTRNREIYHGLRLGSLSVVNRLIRKALQDAADPEAITHARRFRFHLRYAIYRAAALSPRALQITAVFPALSLAIFAQEPCLYRTVIQPFRASEDRIQEAIRLVEAGAPLNKIASLMHVPMAFRRVKPGAADLALSVANAFDDQRLVHAHMPESLPRMKLWLRCIKLADGFGPEFVEWVAKHSLEIGGTPTEVLSLLSDLTDWVQACHRATVPKHIFKAVLGDRIFTAPRGEQFVVRPFSGDMSLKTVIKLSSDWHEAVANNLSGPRYEFPKPWCSGTEACGYEIVPIATSADLYREGHALHHCVGAQGHRVQAGDAYFYSIRKDKERVATLELVRHGGGVEIGQLRGLCNSQVSKKMVRAVESWLRSQREFCFPKKRRLVDDEIDDEIPF
jgi:putative DNA primase/helicase